MNLNHLLLHRLLVIVHVVALVFLFREMSAYVHHRALEVAQKREADTATAVGWGDWNQ